jgi:hypothetical protein
LMRAGRLAAKHNITIQEALVVLRPPTPGAQMPSGGDESPTLSEETDEELS